MKSKVYKSLISIHRSSPTIRIWCTQTNRVGFFPTQTIFSVCQFQENCSADEDDVLRKFDINSRLRIEVPKTDSRRWLLIHWLIPRYYRFCLFLKAVEQYIISHESIVTYMLFCIMDACNGLDSRSRKLM